MDRDDYIKAYLAGGLTKKERAEFEAKLAQDADFAHAFDSIQTGYQLLRLDRQNAYRDTLRALASEQKAHPPVFSASRFSLSWYHIAAVLLILLLPIWLLLTPNSNPDTVFDQYFTPYPDVLSLRNNDSSLDSLLQSGLHAYNLQEYKSSIEAFTALLGKDPTLETALFYQAISHLGLKEGGAAISLLQMIPPESAFKESAEWYLALAYLLDEQVSPSKELLERIKQDNDHSYQAQAEELWKSL